MRASCRAPLILVPGAWQTAQLESPLSECLIDSDYDVKVPAMPSPDTFPAVAVSSKDVSAVRTEFMAEVIKVKDVVVIMHSYGPVIDCEASKGIKSKKPSRYNNLST